MIIAIGIILSLCFAYHPNSDYSYPKRFLLSVFGILLLTYQISQSFPFLALFANYAMISACYFATWNYAKHPCTSFPRRNFAFINMMSVQFMDFLILAVVFLYAPTEILYATPVAAIVGGVLSFIPIKVMSNYLKRKVPVVGFGANTSVNSTLMSLLAIASLISPLPYSFGLIGWAFAGIGAIKTKGSAGVAGLALGSAVYFAYDYPTYVGIIILIAITLSILFSKQLGKFFVNKPEGLWEWWPTHAIFHLSHRDYLWTFAWREVRPLCNRWFGIGFGAFAYLMPAVQINKKEKIMGKSKRIMTWLHNDFLQTVIEGGIIGGVLLVLMLSEFVYLGYADKWFMAFFACAIVNLAANFPARLAPDSLLLVMSIKYLGAL